MESPQQAETKLDRVIRKIKRCLALSKSANEHEAATAMRQAQALMREHRLSEADVHLSDVGEAESSKSRATRRPIWDRNLSQVVAKAFGCKSLRHTYWCEAKCRRVERATFVGVSPAHQIALYAYETLLEKLVHARKEYAAGVRSGQFRSEYSPGTAADHFAIAWVGEVNHKLQALVPKGESDELLAQNSTGQAVVSVEAQDNALIEQYLTDKEVGKARKRRAIELDLNAQIAGMLAGSRVELHAGLATCGQVHALAP